MQGEEDAKTGYNSLISPVRDDQQKKRWIPASAFIFGKHTLTIIFPLPSSVGVAIYKCMP
jgi:hypothetical protein